MVGSRSFNSTFSFVSLCALVLVAFAGSASASGLENTAQAYLLVDTATGTVLESKNPHKVLVPASLTKVMTLRLALKALKEGKIAKDDSVKVSNRAWGGRQPLKGTSIMFLQPNKPVTVEQLIEGAAVASANDACVALAEHISGSVENFVIEMNLEAKRLGLETARFYDPHGLSMSNKISAADMARLGLSMLRDYPEYLEYASRPMMSYIGIKQYNHLRIMRTVDGVDGFKTGYLSRFGYNIVATAERDGRRLLTVVLGTPRRVNGQGGQKVRDQLAAKLLNTGFENVGTMLADNLNTSL